MSVFRVFLVNIFPHWDQMRREREYLSVFSPNAGKYGPENLQKPPNTFHAVVMSISVLKYPSENDV